MIPLALKLKKQAHRDIARAQDSIVEALYKVFDDAVLHGGTAIWRCYNGNRFSEDIDIYIPKNLEKLNAVFDHLKDKGFIIEKKKIGENSLFSVLQLNRIVVRFEALFKKHDESILKEYIKADGNLITVYTLSPEELVKEKVGAYLKRRKIRDLYDVMFLLKYANNKKQVQKELKKLVREFEKPIDEKELKILIIEGLVPDADKMLDYIKNHMG